MYLDRNQRIDSKVIEAGETSPPGCDKDWTTFVSQSGGDGQLLEESHYHQVARDDRAQAQLLNNEVGNIRLK